MSALAPDTDALYQDGILSHASAPRHACRPAVVHAEAGAQNRLCGDVVHVFLRQSPDGHLAEIGFAAEACVVTRASADMMADALEHTSPLFARALAAHVHTMIETGNDADPALAPLRPLASLHAYPSRRRCALLPWEALLGALDRIEAP